MTKTKQLASPLHEHSVPWFWPMAAAIELGEAGMKLFHDNLRYVAEVEEITAPPKPAWATSNHVLLNLDTMRLRDFSPIGYIPSQAPVLIDAPYAGHSSTRRGRVWSKPFRQAA